jgi:hypothetical protein
MNTILADSEIPQVATHDPKDFLCLSLAKTD